LVPRHAAAAPAAAPSFSGGNYVVRAGDTLFTIAAAHGTSWQTIWANNRSSIANPSRIVAGQHLMVPGASRAASAPRSSGDTYVVRSGDTLSEIAARHGTSWRAVWALNRGLIANPDLIFPGQELAM